MNRPRLLAEPPCYGRIHWSEPSCQGQVKANQRTQQSPFVSQLQGYGRALSNWPANRALRPFRSRTLTQHVTHSARIVTKAVERAIECDPRDSRPSAGASWSRLPSPYALAQAPMPPYKARLPFPCVDDEPCPAALEYAGARALFHEPHRQMREPQGSSLSLAGAGPELETCSRYSRKPSARRAPRAGRFTRGKDRLGTGSCVSDTTTPRRSQRHGMSGGQELFRRAARAFASRAGCAGTRHMSWIWRNSAGPNRFAFPRPM